MLGQREWTWRRGILGVRERSTAEVRNTVIDDRCDASVDEVHADGDIVQRNTAAGDVLAFIVEVHIRPGQHRHLDRRVG